MNGLLTYLNNNRRSEWACRLWLTIDVTIIVLDGWGDCHGVLFPYHAWVLYFAALWCYFYRQRAAALILLGITLILYLLHHHS